MEKLIIEVWGYGDANISNNIKDAETFIIYWDRPDKYKAFFSECICGVCGSRDVDNDTGFCINGHDNWVEVSDFFNPDLKGYISEASKNLGLSIPYLFAKIIWDH